jgi:hypothetical protein
MQTAVRAAKILSFLACRQIQRLPRTSPPEYVLVAPSINWWSVVYPAEVRMGLYVEFTGAEGAYLPRIDVFDAEGELLGCLIEGGPFLSKDPVAVHTITLERVSFQVPRPGLYDLVLFFNEEEVARRQLWVRPPDLSA